MSHPAIPQRPFYKKVGFWLLVGLVWAILVSTKKPPSGGSSSAAILVPIFLGAIVVNAIIQKLRKRKMITAYAAEQTRREDVRRQLAEDTASNGLQEKTADKVLTRPGEKCYFAAQASLYEHVTTATKFGGSSARFRIAKGVSVSTGGGRAKRETEFIPVSDGELVATNQRLAFAGDNKSFDTPHAKIINIEYLNDGIKISVSGREKSYAVAIDSSDVLVFRETYKLIRQDLLSS